MYNCNNNLYNTINTFFFIKKKKRKIATIKYDILIKKNTYTEEKK